MMVAQTKGSVASLNFNKGYVYEYKGSYYQFNPNGTGVVNFDYTIGDEIEDFELPLTWKKKTNTVITITRNVGDEKFVYDVKILSNSKISINETGSSWNTFVLTQKSKLLD